MEQHGLLDSETDERSLTLQARLVKDRAKLAEGTERARLFAASAAIYVKAGKIDRRSYPLINAASLSLLAGKSAHSHKLALEVLAVLEANPSEAETPYWLGATQAEALLLLGKEAPARAALRAAIGKQPAAWEDHAATIGQFELLCAELGFDAAWLDPLKPPTSLQFAGIMSVAQGDALVGGQVTSWLEKENVGFAYGALAAGADIWIAEAVLTRGAELHVVLPCDLAAFRERSVIAMDPRWGPRFDALIGEAASLQTLDFSAAPHGPAIELGDAVALGMAMHNARQLCSRHHRLRIVAEGEDHQRWSAADTTLIKAKRAHDPIHGDAEPEIANTALLFLNGKIEQFPTIAEALQFATNGGAAIDLLPVTRGQIPPQISAQLAAMAECAEPGQMLATHTAAHALFAESPDIRIENAGDMRWSGGTMPLFAIR
ncbi:hypothetical protein GCM10023115_01180 [Pontixanthobacter gangjinensis]